METRRLAYFVRIAEDGSLTRAAALLRIAQPALSRQMRLLEEEIGAKLFTRTARGMRLTEEGEQLLASVAGPLRELELAIEAARTAGSRPRGTLAIGLPPGLAELIGASLGIRILADRPGLALRIVEGPTGSLIDWLNRGLIDLALLEEASRDGRLVDTHIAEAPLWLAGSPAAGLRANAPIPLRAMAQMPLVLQAHHLGIRAAIDAAAAAAGIAPDIRAQADAPRLARDLAAAGIGCAVLPLLYCAADVAAGRLGAAPIGAPGVTIGFHLASRRHGRADRGAFAAVERIVAEALRAALPAPVSPCSDPLAPPLQPVARSR